jgi:hypothetical protein
MKKHLVLMLIATMFTVVSCKKEGCTDPLATNFDDEAKKDDGSCTYPLVNTVTLDCNKFNEAGTSYVLEDLGIPVDYIVDCKMPVRGDLKINPGVCIAFQSDAGLIIYDSGSIQAATTATESIILTGVDKVRGSWAGIMIYSNDVKNKLDGVMLEYAGGDDFNSNGDKGIIIIYSGASAEIKNCNISNSASYGINSNYGECEVSYVNNTITTCIMPIFTQADYVSSISGGTYTGNDNDVIFIDTYGGDGYVTTSQTWTDLNVPYRIKAGGNIDIRQVTLTIAAGVEMEFETGAGIVVNDNSALKALGTANNRILFTGVDKLPGAWGSIAFWYTQSPLNEIGFATIEYGSDAESRGSVYMWANPVVNVHDVTFMSLKSCAFYDAPKAQGNPVRNPNLTVTNCTYMEVENNSNYVTDALNSSYCFGG